MMMEKITEEMKIHDQWYKDAREMTLDKLSEFLKKLTTEYEHDYGTICHAMAAGAIATCWAINKTDQGGITGFQAGAIMWEFIRKWMSIECPARLIEYDKMLFPQHANRFENTISQNIWKWLQEEANKRIKENELSSMKAHPNVLAHWESIKNGVVPFDYKIKDE